MFEKLEFGKAVAQIFLSGASDHCACTRRERKQKICCKANEARFQFFKHFQYNPQRDNVLEKLLKMYKAEIMQTFPFNTIL